MADGEDDFSKAVALAYDPMASQEIKAQALQFIQQIKESESDWMNCLQGFVDRIYERDTTRYGCLLVVEHVLTERYSSLGLEHRQYIRQLLFSYLSSIPTLPLSPPPPTPAGSPSGSQASLKLSRAPPPSPTPGAKDPIFIRNKFAEIIVLLLSMEFPDGWGSFFVDVIQQMASGGSGVVDMFLRVLVGIDELIVDREVHRSDQDRTRSNSFKDALRSYALDAISAAWYNILVTYEDQDPDICVLCLQSMAAFIAWMDVSLVSQCLPFVFRYLQESLALREAACACVQALVFKGMDPALKCDLIASLDLTNAITQAIPASKEDQEEYIDFVISLAKLVDITGSVLIECISAQGTQGLDTSKAEALLAEYVPLLAQLLVHEDDGVSEAVFPFAQAYIQLLKPASAAAALTPHQEENVRALLGAVIVKLKYDESYTFAEDDDQEAEFLEFRKNMKTLLTNIAGLGVHRVLDAIHSTVAAILAPHQLMAQGWTDVELALHLVRLVGELVTPVTYEEGSPFAAVLPLVLESAVVEYDHHAVTQQYFEVVAHYCKYFVTAPQHVPQVLGAFLGPLGVHHSQLAVRTRVAYLFGMVFLKEKDLRVHVAPYADQLIEACRPLLALEVGDAKYVGYEAQGFLYEGLGAIVACPESPSPLQYLVSLVEPLLERFQSVVQAELPRAGDVKTQELYADLLCHIIGCMVGLSKGLPDAAALSAIGGMPLFNQMSEVVIHALKIPVESSRIQGAVRSYLHRMINLMQEAILPAIPMAFNELLGNHTAQDLRDFLPLVNHVMTKFHDSIAPFLDEMFEPIVQAIFGILNQPVEENDTQTQTEHVDLRNTYFGFINSIVSTSLSSVLVSPRNAGNLYNILTTIVQGGEHLTDPSVQKVCFSVLRQLVSQFANSTEPALAHFTNFVFQDVLPATLQAPLKPTCSLRDGQTHLLIQEIAFLQLTIARKFEGQFVEAMQAGFLSLGIPQEMIADYMAVVSQCLPLTAPNDRSKSQFAQYLKRFFEQLRQ